MMKLNHVGKLLLCAVICLFLSDNCFSTYVIDFSDPNSFGQGHGNNTMVKDGKLQLVYTNEGLKKFLRDENATLEKITLEEAARYNASDWIYIDNQFFRILRLEPKYIEDIIITLEPELDYINIGEPCSAVSIIIKVNESAILKDYAGVVLEPLNFSYNEGKLMVVDYDYQSHQYKFEADNVEFKGDPLFYPFDSYIAKISVFGGKLSGITTKKSMPESGFELIAHSTTNSITLTKQRSILLRYSLGILIAVIIAFYLNRHVKNLNKSHLTDKTKWVIISSILGVVGLPVTLAYQNLNFIVSIGLIPFLLCFLFSLYPLIKTYSKRDV